MRDFRKFLRVSKAYTSIAAREGAVFLIACYRAVLSPQHGMFGTIIKGIVPQGLLFTGCRFVPSCSEYARDAVRQYGLLRGLMVSSGRIMRCHPWHRGGYDPVTGIMNQEVGSMSDE